MLIRKKHKKEMTRTRTIIVLLSVAILALSFMVTDRAEAFPTKFQPCINCHVFEGVDTLVDLEIWDGSTTTTGDESATTAISVSAGTDLDINYICRNSTQATKNAGTGYYVAVPTGWAVTGGQAGSPASSTLPGWDTIWDETVGVNALVGQGSAWSLNTAGTPDWAGTDSYTVDFQGAGSAYSVGSRGAVCDDAAACDPDGVGELTGVDVRITAGSSSGMVYINCVGHDLDGSKNTKSFKTALVDVTISGGGDVTDPSIGTVTPSNTEFGTFVDDPFDMTATVTEANTVSTCEYCATTDGTCDTEWTAATVGGSAPNWTCTQNGITGFANGASLTLNIRATDDSANTGTGTPILRTVDSAGPAAIADLATGAPTTNSIPLTWGDPSDGTGSGNASYEVRYRVGTTFIEGDWAAATAPGGEPTPPTTGMTVGSLSPSTNYAFAIKTTDNIGNVSIISNAATAQTGAGDPPPTLTISAPNGETVAEGVSFNITYSLSDNISADVDFYYDADAVGEDGSPIAECQNRVEGTDVTCSWTTAPQGTWYVYGIATDSLSQTTTTYSTNPLTVDAVPTLTMNEPNGVGDTVIIGDSYTISANLDDVDSTVTVAFSYDDDAVGLNGTAIGVPCDSVAEGSPTTCLWDTTGMLAGSYYVYGETTDGTSNVSAYSSGQITIEADANPNSPASIGQYYDEVADVTVNSGWSVRDTSIKIQATVTDPNASQQVELEVDIDSNGTADTGLCPTGGLYANGSIIEVTCTGLTDGTTYNWQVRARDENNNLSGWVTGDNFTVKTAMDLGVAGGPNSPPTITVNLPNGVTIAEGTATYNINYDLADSDSAATATFYYDTDTDMTGGTEATGCVGVGEGSGASCTWDTSLVDDGQYWIYGEATDSMNPIVKDLSPGQLTINGVPTLSIAEPDGTADSIPQGNTYLITYTMDDPDDTETVAFYYDTDTDMTGGIAITGACASAGEGVGQTCLWDTDTVGTGSYYVYGLVDDLVNNPVTALSSGQITITANQQPTGSITEPNAGGASVTQGNTYSIVYTMNDVDDNPTVAFFYDTDTDMLGGFSATDCETAPEGTGVPCLWDTSGVPHSTSYYIYGVVNDLISGEVKFLSPGQVTVDQANLPPSLTINQPDGTNDLVVQGNAFIIDYDLSDAEEVVTVAFYYDENSSGFDGTAISGPCAAGVEGAGATCSWTTTGVPGGTYWIYGVSNDGTNPPTQVYSSGTMSVGLELVINPTFASPNTEWTLNLESGTGNCVFDAATTHTADGSESVQATTGPAADSAIRCTSTENIAVLTKDATINSVSVWSQLTTLTEATGDNVMVDVTVPPTIPGNGDTDVILDTDVTINFSEAVDCVSVTNANITSVPAPVTSWSVQSCSGTQAVMRPVGQANSQLYTITVTTAVTDAAGNGLPSNYVFTYTTEAP